MDQKCNERKTTFGIFRKVANFSLEPCMTYIHTGVVSQQGSTTMFDQRLLTWLPKSWLHG